MPAKIYRVTLTIEERESLTTLVNKGTGAAGKLKRARILLMVDEAQENRGWKDDDIAQGFVYQSPDSGTNATNVCRSGYRGGY